MLVNARQFIEKRISHPPCRVTLRQQVSDTFDLPAGSVDMMCAYSVFTHMEHEDSYRYLKDARRIVRPGGRLVFSCLPINLAMSKTVFLDESSRAFEPRWQRVRSVVTSRELMTTIAQMAGWTVLDWHEGDTPFVPDKDSGQSVCSLENPA